MTIDLDDGVDPTDVTITADRRTWTLRCIDFVRTTVGLPVLEVRAVDGFLPAIRVVDGGLEVDVDRVFPGDVLHDAGHLSVIPSRFRAEASGDLTAVCDAMNVWLVENTAGLERHPEDPTCRQVLQSSEAEAIAWQYAAARAIELPDQWLFPPDGFDGEGPGLLLSLRLGSHLGVNGLQAAQWTHAPSRLQRHAVTYPALSRWLAA